MWHNKKRIEWYILDIKNQNKRVDPYLWENIQKIVEILKNEPLPLSLQEIAKRKNSGVGNVTICCIKAADIGLLECEYHMGKYGVLKSFYKVKKSGENGL